jgi:hypothetical protein
VTVVSNILTMPLAVLNDGAVSPQRCETYSLRGQAVLTATVDS